MEMQRREVEDVVVVVGVGEPARQVAPVVVVDVAENAEAGSRALAGRLAAGGFADQIAYRCRAIGVAAACDKLVEQGILQKQVALKECDRFVEAQIKELGALVVASGAKPN